MIDGTFQLLDEYTFFINALETLSRIEHVRPPNQSQ